MSPATFTASIERLGDFLAASYEDGVQRLADLPHTEAARYRGLAAELVSRCLPRDTWALAMVLALLVERRHHEAISTVQFARHVDTADNVLRHF